jgi:hypothetical protein
VWLTGSNNALHLSSNNAHLPHSHAYHPPHLPHSHAYHPLTQLIEHFDEAVGKLNTALSFWDKTFNLHFWGSDDRVGGCFEAADIPENQRQYKMLGIQAVNEWTECVLQCASCSAAMKQQATSFIAKAEKLALAFRNSTVPTPPPTPAPGPAHCGAVHEDQPLALSCGTQKIKAVTFANYGTLSGSCPAPKAGSCHADITSIVTQACVGKSSCTISCTAASTPPGYIHHCNGSPVSDPCFDTPKEVTAAVVCASTPVRAPAPPAAAPSLEAASELASSWLDQLELHSAAAAVAANITTAAEEAILHARFFRNPVQWCSFSPFNSYFLLNAVGQMRTTAKSEAYCTALSMVHSCWGGMVELGATTFWCVGATSNACDTTSLATHTTLSLRQIRHLYHSPLAAFQGDVLNRVE